MCSPVASPGASVTISAVTLAGAPVGIDDGLADDGLARGEEADDARVLLAGSHQSAARRSPTASAVTKRSAARRQGRNGFKRCLQASAITYNWRMTAPRCTLHRMIGNPRR